jgi:hypothetical protein
MNMLNDKLRQITLEAFESVCRLFPLMEGEGREGLPLAGAVSVDFSGPIAGTFCMWFFGRLPQVIAESMLGGAASSYQTEDAMKEIANVICGNILPYVAGPEPILKLDAPRLEPSSGEGDFPKAAAAETRILFPGGSIRLAIFLNTP